MELIIINIIKNAVHAVKDLRDGKVEVSVRAGTSDASFLVRDNGTALDDETFGALGQVAESSKTEGLGIGLTLCKTMIPTYGGRINFERAKPQGLIVEVTLPLSNAEINDAYSPGKNC